MAYDMFLKVEGIDGDSTDAKHGKWIEILSYSHRISRHHSHGTITGASEHKDFTITKRLDKASVMLASKCSSGAEIPEVTLELCRATGDKTTFMVYKLTQCAITSFSPGGSGKAEDPLPMEEVTFGYGMIEWTYTATVPGGKDEDVHQATYDLREALDRQ